MELFQKFYDRALRFLSYRPRSEKEILDFLKRKKVDAQVTSKILKKLKKLSLVNDKEFAKWWIEQRQGSKPRGWRLIKIELKQKGVSNELITNHSPRGEAGQLPITSEKELARKAIEKKAAIYKKLPRDKAYQKLAQFLLRRGFDWDAVKIVVDHVLRG